MKLYLVKEFIEHDWYPHYKKIKKLLRKNGIPFKIRKQPSDDGLIHSIWSTEKYIQDAILVIHQYYSNDPKVKGREARIEKYSKEFEETWFKSLIFTIHGKLRSRSILVLIIMIVMFAMILFPIFQYT